MARTADILTLGGALSARQKSLLERGRLPLRRLHCNMRGTVPWVSSQCHDLLLQRRHARHEAIQDIQQPTKPVFFLPLRCPRCGDRLNVARRTLFQGTKWRSVKCGQCSKHSSAGLWHCLCAKPWHQCNTHRAIGMRCGRVHPNGLLLPTWGRRVGDGRPGGDRPSSQGAPFGGPEEADNHAVSSSGANGAAPEVQQVALPTSGRGRKRPCPALAPSHVHVSAVLAKCPKLAARFPHLAGTGGGDASS